MKQPTLVLRADDPHIVNWIRGYVEFCDGRLNEERKKEILHATQDMESYNDNQLDLELSNRDI